MAKEKKKGDDGLKIVSKNRRARYDFDLLERFEAGLVLKGSEVKSIRDNKVSLNESYAKSRGGEIFVFNMDIQPYKFAGPDSHEPKRPRKLLLNKHEIRKLLGKTREKGLTLVPVSLYLKRGRVKLEIALAQGRVKGDKREKLKKKEVNRELRQRTMRR